MSIFDIFLLSLKSKEVFALVFRLSNIIRPVNVRGIIKWALPLKIPLNEDCDDCNLPDITRYPIMEVSQRVSLISLPLLRDLTWLLNSLSGMIFS